MTMTLLFPTSYKLLRIIIGGLNERMITDIKHHHHHRRRRRHHAVEIVVVVRYFIVLVGRVDGVRSKMRIRWYGVVCVMNRRIISTRVSRIAINPHSDKKNNIQPHTSTLTAAGQKGEDRGRHLHAGVLIYKTKACFCFIHTSIHPSVTLQHITFYSIPVSRDDEFSTYISNTL